MTKTEFILSEEELGKRLDLLLTHRFPSYSRTYFQYLIDEGLVTRNHLPIKKREKGHVGDTITLTFKPLPAHTLEAEEIPLDILYEDNDLIAINKPSSMVVHPGAGQPNQTFVNALLFHVKDLPLSDDPIRPGIVHRLDKDTSGVLIAAKNEQAHRLLVSLFKNREMEKGYIAVCKGIPRKTGLISMPIKRDPYHREKMSVHEEGKEAITDVTLLAKDSLYSVLSLKPKTGRTHQLRVHLKALGSPILHDPIYGHKGGPGERLLLHAFTLSFIHPVSQKRIELKAPLPEPFLPWFEKFRLSPQ